MGLSEKAIDEFQEIFKKEYGKELTRAEASDSANRLGNLYKILLDGHIKDLQRKDKLKEFPKGYSFMDGGTYNCSICNNYIKDEKLWYDKWGIKCLSCQEAVDKKIIPGKVCYGKEEWYSTWELGSDFQIKSPTVRKLARHGILKARTIPSSGFQLFLVKDNPGVLPSKKIVDSRMVQTGDNQYSTEFWYEFKDPKKVLRDYKILKYCNFDNPKPSLRLVMSGPDRKEK